MYTSGFLTPWRPVTMTACDSPSRLRPASRHRADRVTGAAGSTSGHGRWRAAVRLVLAWALIIGVLVAVGAALTGPLRSTVGVVDNDIVRSIASHRSAELTDVAEAVSTLGDTSTELVLNPLLLLVTWVWLRQIRPVVFLAVACVGEIAAYLVTVSLISRPRPPVELLHRGLEPMHSYPSGHVAAAMATYGGLAVLVWVYGNRHLVWLSAALLLLPPLVALARLYQGVHHLTDVLVSIAFMSAWLAAAGAVLLRRPGPGTGPGPKEPGAQKRLVPRSLRGRPSGSKKARYAGPAHRRTARGTGAGT